MTDLKELIEQEIDQYLEWPTADKSHVTTVSAKLFAEHMARLYADHIPEAAKKIGRRQIREVFLRNGARIEPDRDDLPDYVYESVFELLEMAAPAGKGEPVAWISLMPGEDLARVTTIHPSSTFHPEGMIFEPLYTAPQPAEQQPVYQRCEYCDGTGDVHSIDGEWRGACDCQPPAPDVSALVEALEEARRELNSCQSVIHYAGGFDPAYVTGAQAALVKIGAALATHRKQGGGHV